jgi:ATP-dependent protease ClpP protease subunit
MRNLASSFTMRKDGVLPRGDWYRIENKKDSDTADIYLYDEIGFWGTEASEFVKELTALDADFLNVHINSPGGEIFDGLAIYNALKQNKADVTVYVDGLAASAASFIAQAGNNVVMARNAQMMIHDGVAMAYGNEQDMLDTAELLGKLSNNIADIYHQAADKRGAEENSTEYFRGLMQTELWMNGQEAKDLGLADEVTDADDKEAEDAKNKWDLSFYNYAGREKAESPLRVQERIRLANQQKGNTMGDKPKATNEPEPTGDPVPDPTPEPTPDPAPEPSGDPTPEPTDKKATPAAPEPTNVQGVMIDGKMTTDWSVINKHFATMQAAQNEAKEEFRKNFVEQLAASNKIPAPQIESLVKLVNGDGDKLPAMTDEQFAGFQASYESSAPSSLFNNHATQDPDKVQNKKPGDSTFQASSDTDTQTEVETLEGIIAMHRRQMPEDRVKETKSYKRLQELQSKSDKS